MNDAVLTSATPPDSQADLFQGLSPKERADNLESMAYSISEEPYMRPLTEEELTTRKNNLVNNSVELNKIAIEKKAVTAELNGRATRLSKLNKNLLDDITHKAVQTVGRVFEIFDDTERFLDRYNEDGIWLGRRRATSEDSQRHISQMRINN